MSELFQPVYAVEPEPGHKLSDVLTLQEFIDLLKEEEDYYPGEQHNTKLMITRLRKIFYDQWGWNSELVRADASIEGRYQVSIMDSPTPHGRAVTRYKNKTYAPKYREVTYRANDRVYGNTRVGQVPFIYKLDHQEIVLPEGNYCDAAHILAGLDACNNPQVVSPLPNFLRFLYFIGPHVNSNMDIVTWLGDIASSSGDFLIDYLGHKKKPLTTAAEQNHINIDAPGSDMLGDIEPFIIAKHYDVSSANGQRYTEILEDYYFKENLYRQNRCASYCSIIGLKDWDGANFGNEKEWLKYYRIQLRDNITFQVFSLVTEKVQSFILLFRIWLNGFTDVLKIKLLLEIYLKTLKEIIKTETNN